MEKFPLLWVPALLAVMFVAAYVFMVLFIFAEPLLGSVAWWQLGVSSVLAAISMGAYLFKRHPVSDVTSRASRARTYRVEKAVSSKP